MRWTPVLALLAAAAGVALAVPASPPAQQQPPPTCPPGTSDPAYCPPPGPPPRIQLSDGTRSQLRGRGRRRCVTRDIRFRATVTAPNGIDRVTVSLDGRRLRRFTTSRIALTIRVRRLRRGRHTITVVAVDDARRTTRRSYTFRVCPRRAARQRRRGGGFTG